ncbi:MAG TPA: mitofilin family membrane protein [Acetobacteraceae bacterium]|jgi:hypothetical protein|nr:mitofilin family membrane protein [Acetobacteraceae bacterium]
MTEPEPPATPQPETPEEPAPPPPPREAARRDRLAWLSGAGFLILAAALAWVWLNPYREPPAATPVDALAQPLASLEARMARLEQRPVAAPTPAVQAPDLGPLTARVAALEQRQVPNLAPLEARIAALEARPPVDTQLAGRIDALSARADSLETALRTIQSDLARRLDADEARIATAERNAGQISALADRMGRVARVQAAQLALNTGQKLGEMSGAPPALARFAATPPPTEATLRLAFPQAAREALAAAKPPTEGKPLLARLWAETQDLVTVRQGDRVLVGDPAAGVLEHARAALDAGDLAAAVAAVSALTGAPAQAMAGWLADARALMEARAALIDWAAHA